MKRGSWLSAFAIETAWKKIWKRNEDRRLTEPLDEQELDALRQEGIRRLIDATAASHAFRARYFTCDSCDKRRACPFVYDLYNQSSRCLAERARELVAQMEGRRAEARWARREQERKKRQARRTDPRGKFRR